MNWDVIQQGWQSTGPAPERSEVERMARDARQRARKLHRRVRWRDGLETVVAVVLAPVFAWLFHFMLGHGMWLAAAGSALIAVWCLYVPWRLHRARRLLPDPKASADMLSYLRQERVATRAQYELLRSILRWYLGPAAVGVFMVYYGIRGWSMETLYYFAAVFVLYGLIYIGNRSAASKQLAPALERIERAIEELENGQHRQ